MDENGNIMVSVICMTYNHEAYIRDAIEGFLMQKTDFNYEIIIHDDASTDSTAEIIKSYAEKYPNRIIPILQIENQRRLKVNKEKKFIFPIARGKYFAICEGDDYWIDENKLQKQVKYMEEHPNCSMSCHNSYRLDCLTGKYITENPFNNCKMPTAKQLITQEAGWPATASLVYRAKDAKSMPEMFRNLPVGDTPKRLYLLSKGYIYYFPDIMSVYRYNNSVSWTSRFLSSISMQEEFYSKMINFYEKYDEYTEYRYTEYITNKINLDKRELALITRDWESLSKNPEFIRLSKKQKMRYIVRIKLPILYKILKKLKNDIF